MNESSSRYDVAIIGGGLAGLTLALQLKRKSPGLEIVVLERNHLPPPVAAHKVGESTVEIGAHYLSHTLGLKSLLESTQLRKFGLRFFFGSGNHDDLAKADELGVSDFLPVISYQLDRGRLEGDLAEILQSQDVTVMAECFVKHMTIAAHGAAHELQVTQKNQTRNIRCQWVIDATSRFGLLKRSLHLERACDHRVNAAWFRLDTSIAVDNWSNSSAWNERCNGFQRRLSTNHLMGSGYWAWIIPLAGNRTSVGLVADPDFHSLSSFSSYSRLLAWLSVHQPQLAQKVSGASDSLMDFRHLKNLSHDCKQLWSVDRWALTGESSVFADPYYSPGTDFIAISNTLICDLITNKRSESMFHVHAEVYQRMYKSFFSNTMSLYEQLYPGFGDTRLMVVKSVWDYAYYWSVLAWLFFREVMTDITFMRMIKPELKLMLTLNSTLQSVFRARASEKRSGPGKGRFFDQCAIPVLTDLKAALLKPTDNPKLEFTENCARLQALALLLPALLNGTLASGNRQDSLLGDLNSRFE